MNTILEITLLRELQLQKDNPLYVGFRKLHVATFGEDYTQKMEEELPTMRNCILWIAHENNKVLGFKLGYELEIDEYYSWRGAVIVEERKRGIGSTLMLAQHKWCKDNGYARIQTRTRNQWRDMLMLDLKHGFNITGTILDEKQRLKIILEKDL